MSDLPTKDELIQLKAIIEGCDLKLNPAAEAEEKDGIIYVKDANGQVIYFMAVDVWEEFLDWAEKDLIKE